MATESTTILSGERPVYERPPVVETQLCVQFEPLKRFKSLCYGMLWFDKLAEAGWQPIDDLAPIPRLAERFGEVDLGVARKGDGKEIAGIRVKFKNESLDRSLQIQPDKVFYSWLKTTGAKRPRPHFTELKAEFTQQFELLRVFVEETNLGKITPDLWEVRYSNVIPSGELWSNPEDWHRILPHLFTSGVRAEGGVKFVTFDGKWIYEIEPELGRVEVRTAKSLVNKKPPPVLSLV